MFSSPAVRDSSEAIWLIVLSKMVFGCECWTPGFQDSSHGKPAYLSPQVEFIQGDVTDREKLGHALRDVDVVSHQAAYQDYMPDFSRFLHVNAVGTALIYELIVRHRLPVKKVIVASSQAVYGEGQYSCPEHGHFCLRREAGNCKRENGKSCVQSAAKKLTRHCFCAKNITNPYNQYAVSKLAQEKTALGVGWLNGIPTVALRYSITQGPRQSLFNHYSGVCRIFVSRALRGEPLVIYEDGLQTRDFVHVQDAVDANMLVLQNDEANFHAFNVGSGLSTSVLTYAKAVGEKLGSPVELTFPGEYRRGDNRHSVSSIEKLRALGWEPRRNLSTILDDFLEWVEKSGGIPDELPDAYSNMKHSGVVLAAVH